MGSMTTTPAITPPDLIDPSLLERRVAVRIENEDADYVAVGILRPAGLPTIAAIDDAEIMDLLTRTDRHAHRLIFTVADVKWIGELVAV